MVAATVFATARAAPRAEHKRFFMAGYLVGTLIREGESTAWGLGQLSNFYGCELVINTTKQRTLSYIEYRNGKIPRL